jgi:hypothetical protein
MLTRGRFTSWVWAAALAVHALLPVAILRQAARPSLRMKL